MIKYAKGAIYGAMIGDAIGAHLEFFPGKATKKDIDNALNMIGGGAHKIAPGQITDDGELTLCLMNSIIESQGYDDITVAKSYLKWFKSEPFDCGFTIEQALDINPKEGQNPADLMTLTARELNMNSKSNGALMRQTPLGVWSSKLSIDEAAKVTAKDTSLTHPNISCQNSSIAYVLAIRHLMLNPGDHEGAYNSSLKWLKENDRNEVYQWILDSNSNKDVPFYPQSGFVKIAFIHAFRTLLKKDNYENSIRAIISERGDTDTNACIAGGLIGAALGIDEIPTRMQNSLLNCDTSLGSRERPDFLKCMKIQTKIEHLINN